MRAISKKKNNEFVDAVCKGLLELGANKVKDQIDSFRAFELETIVGKLIINVVIDNYACFTVFSRFEDVEKAKQKFTCNPHSGKYNVHIGASGDMTGKKAAEIALIAFDCTIPNECSTTSPL
jgi:hypothetical protein